MKRNCSHVESFSQVHLATTRHRRCREELSLRCSLDADASGVSDGETALYPSATSLACLAQLVEHLICNQRVGGSNPSTGIG